MTSTLKTNAIEPEGGTTNMVVGQSGQNTVISNNDIRANVLQDSGGNAVFTSNGSGTLSGVNSGFGSAMVLLSTNTTAGAASIDITSGIDSTYKEYIFKFYDIDIVTNQANVTFQVNAVGQSGFDETITSTWFYAALDEISDGQFFAYQTSHDQAQGTGYQTLTKSNQNDADASSVGELHLFNPSSTTYVKKFYSRMGAMGASSVRYTEDQFAAGYINTTSAIDEISFKASAGNIAGTIKMYGVK